MTTDALLSWITENATDSRIAARYAAFIASRRQGHAGPMERHHVIPRAIRRDLANTPSNIVRLSAREHFVAHLLLSRMFSGEWRFKMLLALRAMCRGRGDVHSRKFLLLKVDWASINSRLASRPKSALHRARIAQARLGKRHAEATKKKAAETRRSRGTYDTSWNQGRPHPAEVRAKIAAAAAARPMRGAANPNAKSFALIAPDASTFITDDLPAFAALHGLRANCLYNVANGYASSHLGWKCDHLDGILLSDRASAQAMANAKARARMRA